MGNKKTKTVYVKDIPIGGENPVVIQSMTNTDTCDYVKTAIQISELVEAGSEIVRITINNIDAARNVQKIVELLDKKGIYTPIVGDFHFNGHKILKEVPSCAKLLAKYRINPGNVGRGEKKDKHFAEIIETAIRYDKPIRIGANWGSIDSSVLSRLTDKNSKRKTPLSSKELMYEVLNTSVLESAMLAKDIGLSDDKIILSVKMSQVIDLINVYRKLKDRTNLPLHLGLTEAGMGNKGIISSTAAISILLNEGIGDTIRVSLTPMPNESRIQEVLVAKEILQALQIKSYSPQVTSCPGCGRTSSNYFQELTMDIDKFLKEKMPEWGEKYPKCVYMKVAVMGCVVNGPGESKAANIGISLPGSGEAPVAPVYVDGNKTVTLKGESLASDFKDIIESYVKTNYTDK